MLAWHQWLSSALVNIHLHAGIDVVVKSFLLVRVIFVDVSAEVIVVDLVSFLVFSVIWKVFLDSIVG